MADPADFNGVVIAAATKYLVANSATAPTDFNGVVLATAQKYLTLQGVQVPNDINGAVLAGCQRFLQVLSAIASPVINEAISATAAAYVAALGFYVPPDFNGRVIAACSAYLQRPTPTRFVSAAGNDANDGLTAATSWLTIAKVNAVAASPGFPAGAVIGFRGGDTFVSDPGLGILINSGTVLLPIKVVSYGVGRATINIADVGGYGIDIYDNQYVEFDGFNVIVSGAAIGDATSQGIGIATDLTDATRYPGVKIRNVKITGAGFGVQAGNYAVSGTSGFDDMQFSNIEVVNPTAKGFFTFASNTPATLDTFLRMTVNGYTCTGAAGAGFYVSYCKDGWLQNGTTSNNGAGTSDAVGQGCFKSNNFWIRYGVSHDNTSNGNSDGDGFDLDGGNINCGVEYCLAYSNKGAGFMHYAYAGSGTWDSNTIRYCIGFNNGTNNDTYGELRLGLQPGGGATMTNGYVYNCTFYNNLAGRSVVRIDDATITGRIANNIFYAGANNPKLVFAATDGTDLPVSIPNALLFQGNDYFAAGTFAITDNGATYASVAAWQAVKTVQEKVSAVNVSLSVNPLLAKPGGPLASDYKILPGSLMRGSGQNILSLLGVSPGGQDYFGNTIPNALGFNISADGK